MVRLLSEDEVEDIYRARRVLETAGAHAVEQATRADLTALLDAQRRYEERVKAGADPGSVTEAHLGVHVAVVGLLGSPRLTATARELMSEVRLAVATVDRTSDDLPAQVREHRRIVTLIRQAKGAEAARLLSEHLSHAKAFVPTDR